MNTSLSATEQRRQVHLCQLRRRKSRSRSRRQFHANFQSATLVSCCGNMTQDVEIKLLFLPHLASLGLSCANLRHAGTGGSRFIRKWKSEFLDGSYSRSCLRPHSHRTRRCSQMLHAKNGTHSCQLECSHSIANNCKQHQRICKQICVQICVLCELGPIQNLANSKEFYYFFSKKVEGT